MHQIWCNNQVTVDLTSNPMYYQIWIKHLTFSCHFFREELAEKRQVYYDRKLKSQDEKSQNQNRNKKHVMSISP